MEIITDPKFWTKIKKEYASSDRILVGLCHSSDTFTLHWQSYRLNVIHLAKKFLREKIL